MTKTIKYKNKQINYSDSGQGNVLVLLHGFLESLEMWKIFSAELTKYFRVISIDLPGFGKSDCIEDVNLMELMAEVVKFVLDSLQIKKCVMAGHSMGGYITLAFADKFPEMLKGICLFHSQALPDTPEVKLNRERSIEIIKSQRENFINRFIPDLFAPSNLKLFKHEIEELQEKAGKTTAKGIIAAMEGMKNREGKLEFLSITDIPVLFIAGKQDPRVPIDKVMAQAILPKHSEMLILGDVAHMGHIEDKEATLKTLKYFVMKCFE